MTEEKTLSHLDADGHARMVDVGSKPLSSRVARASGRVRMRPETLLAIVDGRLPKGDVLAVARIAGIQAAKQTAQLIPLCHPLPISGVEIALDADDTMPGIQISASVKVTGQTGVEMEALTAVSVAALTLYDMCKAIDREMVIESIQLEEKAGGVRGDWQRHDHD
jgi:cyclic pyranopterin phosphate synthase